MFTLTVYKSTRKHIASNSAKIASLKRRNTWSGFTAKIIWSNYVADSRTTSHVGIMQTGQQNT